MVVVIFLLLKKTDMATHPFLKYIELSSRGVYLGHYCWSSYLNTKIKPTWDKFERCWSTGDYEVTYDDCEERCHRVWQRDGMTLVMCICNRWGEYRYGQHWADNVQGDLQHRAVSNFTTRSCNKRTLPFSRNTSGSQEYCQNCQHQVWSHKPTELTRLKRFLDIFGFCITVHRPQISWKLADEISWTYFQSRTQSVHALKRGCHCTHEIVISFITRIAGKYLVWYENSRGTGRVWRSGKFVWKCRECWWRQHARGQPDAVAGHQQVQAPIVSHKASHFGLPRKNHCPPRPLENLYVTKTPRLDVLSLITWKLTTCKNWCVVEFFLIILVPPLVHTSPWIPPL